MRLGVLTSVATRHRYFARRLCAVFDVAAVAYEEIGYVQPDVGLGELTPDETQIVAAHFAERARQEELFFAEHSAFLTETADSGMHPALRVRHLKPVRGPDPASGSDPASGRKAACGLESGQMNTAATLHFLETSGVDTVVVFGTNLIKPPLLSRWPGRMINMHLGLSPYYRGTATNFYPLLNEEPQYVGATIHLLDAGIDSGPILRHARPTIVADDQPHTIGCKAILAGIDAMIHVLHQLDRDSLTPVTPWDVPNAKLYLRKHYHPRQLVELYRKLEAGLIPRYVERARKATIEVRLVE